MSNYKHGLSYSPVRLAWRNMKGRCYNPNDKRYKYYGARGIKVCDRWKDSLLNFVEDMGERLPGMSLERIDNDKDYSPENCCWIPRGDQNKNTTKSRRIAYLGVTHHMSEWSRRFDLPNPEMIGKRLKLGWTVPDALEIRYKRNQNHKNPGRLVLYGPAF